MERIVSPVPGIVLCFLYLFFTAMSCEEYDDLEDYVPPLVDVCGVHQVSLDNSGKEAFEIVGNRCPKEAYMLSIVRFDNTEYSTYIEHIGSNDIDSFNMRMESVDRKSFSVAPGVQVARYLSKRMYLYAELSYLFNPGSSYGEYTLHNLYTQELIEKKRFKDACTDALQLRLGMSIRLF